MPTNLVCKNIFSTTQDFKGFTELLKCTLSSKPHKEPVPQGDVRILPLLSNFLPFDNAATCLSSSLFLACNCSTVSLWAFSILFIFVLKLDSWYWKSAFNSVNFLSFSKIVWSLCCRRRLSDITSSFSWLMRTKLSVPPLSADWFIELLKMKNNN